MAKRFTDTNKYKKSFYRGLPGPYKLLWDFLYHECDHAGIWHADFEIAQVYLGKDMPVNESDAIRLFNDGEERIKVLPGGKWFIAPFIAFQYECNIEDLNPANKAHSGVIKILIKHNLISKPLDSSLVGANIAPQDKEKDKEKDKEGTPIIERQKKFTHPSIQEVSDYCQERKNSVDPQKWIDHYTSNGWRVGKNPMRDWKAAVRTWEKSEIGGTNAGLQTSSSGRAGRNFAEERAQQQRERDARILAGSNSLPRGIHRKDAFRAGRDVVDAEAVEVPEVEAG